MRLSKLGGPNYSVYQNGVRLNMSQHDERATVLKMIKTGHNTFRNKTRNLIRK